MNTTFTRPWAVAPGPLSVQAALAPPALSAPEPVILVNGPKLTTDPRFVSFVDCVWDTKWTRLRFMAGDARTKNRAELKPAELPAKCWLYGGSFGLHYLPGNRFWDTDVDGKPVPTCDDWRRIVPGLWRSLFAAAQAAGAQIAGVVLDYEGTQLAPGWPKPIGVHWDSLAQHSPAKLAELQAAGWDEDRWNDQVLSIEHAAFAEALAAARESYPSLAATCSQFRLRCPWHVPVLTDRREQQVGSGYALDFSSTQVLDGTPIGYRDVLGRRDNWSRFLRDRMFVDVLGRRDNWSRFLRDRMFVAGPLCSTGRVMPWVRYRPSVSTGGRDGYDYARSPWWEEGLRHALLCRTPLVVTCDNDAPLADLRATQADIARLLAEVEAQISAAGVGPGGACLPSEPVGYGRPWCVTTLVDGHRRLSRVAFGDMLAGQSEEADGGSIVRFSAGGQGLEFRGVVDRPTFAVLPGSPMGLGAWVRWRV